MLVDVSHLTQSDVLYIIGVATAVAGFLAWTRKRTRPVWLKLKYLLEDWHGTPARPGVPGRMGAMERIAGIEANQLQTLTMIASNRAETQRDIAQVQADVSALIMTMADHSNQLQAFGERMDASERDREGIHREISVFKFGGTERQT